LQQISIIKALFLDKRPVYCYEYQKFNGGQFICPDTKRSRERKKWIEDAEDGKKD